jgi:hypothetical protein
MKNRKHARRIKRLALICTLCTIILVVSTYAWFVGMKTVNVSTFDVQIAATDGLSLSIDGQNWSETVTINSSNFANAYTGNTNTWTKAGLIPVSTVGVIDTTSSNLVMFEKGSLTTTHGGYRLMASRVNNNDSTKKTGEKYNEADGYVAFDLFVRNLSGNEYYTESNKLNEEAIYLTQESKVAVVSQAGDKQDQTGIENSVRVAFAQIGRVKATKGADIGTTEAQKIQQIACGGADAYNESTGVTGVCSKGATIWEPNDTKHVANAISWYNKACKQRLTPSENADTATDITLTTSYGNANTCATVTDGIYSPTYAINAAIDYKDRVDVYDGLKYNKYTLTTGTAKYKNADGTEVTPKLQEYNYFTDTEKMLTGMDRPEFMSLAPNSITRVRVYVYLEGQDIDNYDFASLGKKIQVSFGFTKERFFDSDLDNYNGPMSVTQERQDGNTKVEVETKVPTTKENQA